MRLTRRGALGLSVGGLSALCGCSASARPGLDTLDSETIAVRSQPIRSFMARNPDQLRFGALTFRGGLVLSSSNKAFGGFSGLSRSADGAHLIAITDNAHWLTARI